MLVQPKMKISAPHSLLDPLVPGRLLPSGQWGINRAAALLNFPDDGLQVVIPIWATKAVGDTVKLLLNDREVDGRPIIDAAELKQPTLLWVAPRHLQTGPYQLTYEIKQPNQKEERPDKPLNLFVKLELPGGQDIDPGPGHSNLYMYIPPEIVNGGVDKDVAEAGVPIVIRSAAGGLPYPDIAQGDVIHLSWGGFFEYSTPVTLEQINDPAANPILITVSKATIERAGDTDLFGLAVTFKVRDIVGNESEDWCKATRIVVTTGIDLLAAPIVQEAVNNELDADKQGDNDITVHVTATRPDFEMDDIIHLTMLGTTLEGEKVEVTALPQTVDNIPHNYEFKLSIAAVRKLVNTQVSFFYRLERSGSSDPLRSKGQFVQVTGAAHRLAAPIIEEAEGDFIDPTKTPINVRIPFDPAIEYGMGIELFLLGKSPDGSTFLPELEWHIPEEYEVENPEGFVITVDDYNLKLLDGGTLKGWYDLLIAEGDEILRRESLHTKLLNVGEPKFELDAPIVLGVANGFLDPATLPGGTSRLTIPRPVVKPWVANDEATWKWVGDISGEEPGSRTFNAVTAQQDWVINLDAAFVAQHIEPNRGSKITVRYQLWRHATDETSLSNPLVFTVGVALELLAPWIKENNGDSALNPLLVRDTLTIVVPDNSALLPTDEIIATWTGAQGTPAGGSHTSAPRPLGSNREFAIPNSVVAFNLNKDVKVSYVVIRDGKPLPSLVFDLTVLSMPQNELLKPIIKDADNDGEGPEFNVGNLTSNATYRMGVWPLIATGQYVWLRLKGTNADGSDYNLQIHTAPGSYVTDQWIAQGYYERSIALEGLKNLKDGSPLTMEFKAAFGKNTNESEAVDFPVRTYTVKATHEAELTFINQPYLKKYNDLVEDIVLNSSTTQGVPVPNEKITLNLPAGFTYADNGNGSRDFWTDNNGMLTVSGVKAKGNPGTYNLIAVSGTKTATARLTIVGYTELVAHNTSAKNIAITADGLRVLTVDNSYSVGLYDAVNLSQIKTTRIGDYPTHAAITPDGSRAFITSRNILFVIDMLNLSVIKTIGIETIPYPFGVAITPDGAHTFVSAFNGSSVSVINVQSLSVIKTIFTGANSRPSEIAITPDGKQAFVIDSLNQSVSIIDTKSYLVTKTIALLTQGSLTAIGITPDGLYAFIVASAANKVVVIDVPSQSVKKNISVMRGSKHIAIAPGGRHVFLTSHDTFSAVSVIDTVSLEVILDAHLPAMGVMGIAITPDGTRAIACNNKYLTVIAAG
ncbi:YncE family protein [Pseudomonas sp. JQ36]